MEKTAKQKTEQKILQDIKRKLMEAEKQRQEGCEVYTIDEVSRRLLTIINTQ